MAVTIGVIAIKGGVGKTTVSASLASDLVNNHQKKVLLIDANYSAPNLGLHMDVLTPEKTVQDVLSGKTKVEGAVKNSFGVDVIAGDPLSRMPMNSLKLKDRLSKIKKDYDFIIIDSSPNLNEEILSTILASDKLFVVSTPDYPTLSCSLKAAQLAKHRGKPISGIIVNKIRDPSYELSLEDIEGAMGIPVVARIPDDKNAIRALFTRIPISIYSPKSGFSKELGNLSKALVCSKEKVSWWKKLTRFNLRKEEVNRELLRESLYRSVFKKNNG
jgi:MinD-like ATPase involved in chromosome partitioning or flagellar assembly